MTPAIESVFIEELTTAYDVARAEAAATLRGRGRSGFCSAGYHELSYLVGRVDGAAAFEQIPRMVVPTIHEIRQAGLEDARADLETRLLAGEDVWSPPERRGASS